MRKVIADSMMSYLSGKVKYHQANVKVYLQSPVGIGEHPDIMAAIEEELAKAAEYQEKEGPPIARLILNKLKANEDLVDEVCDIIGHHHHPGPDESLNFKVVFDADLIANLEDNIKEKPMETKRLTEIIEKNFLTAGGKKEAMQVLLA